MKAIRVSEYGGPAVLKLEEIPTPQPGPNQVLVRNHAVGINPVDTYLRSNTDNRGPKLPYTPGGSTQVMRPSRISTVTGSPQSRHGASTRTVSPGKSHVADVASNPHCANQRCSPPTVIRYWVGRLLSGGNDAM